MKAILVHILDRRLAKNALPAVETVQVALQIRNGLSFIFAMLSKQLGRAIAWFP
jgi:hypothetical protein